MIRKQPVDSSVIRPGRLTSSNTSYNSVASRTEKVMTRNLGAAWNDNTSKSFGLLYQWGRKDPFVGASSNASGTTTFATSTMGQKWGDASHVKTLTGASEANITSAIANPTTFYLQRNTTQYDWVGDTYANQRDNLWGIPIRLPRRLIPLVVASRFTTRVLRDGVLLRRIRGRVSRRTVTTLLLLPSST